MRYRVAAMLDFGPTWPVESLTGAVQDPECLRMSLISDTMHTCRRTCGASRST